jgi:hypothetical protein
MDVALACPHIPPSVQQKTDEGFTKRTSSRGQQESRSGIAAKADGLHAPEGSSPGCDMASAQDPTGV